MEEQRQTLRAALLSGDPFSPFSHQPGVRLNHRLRREVALTAADGSSHAVTVVCQGDGRHAMTVGGTQYQVRGWRCRGGQA